MGYLCGLDKLQSNPALFLGTVDFAMKLIESGSKIYEAGIFFSHESVEVVLRPKPDRPREEESFLGIRVL